MDFTTVFYSKPKFIPNCPGQRVLTRCSPFWLAAGGHPPKDADRSTLSVDCRKDTRKSETLEHVHRAVGSIFEHSSHPGTGLVRADRQAWLTAQFRHLESSARSWTHAKVGSRASTVDCLSDLPQTIRPDRLDLGSPGFRAHQQCSQATALCGLMYAA